MRIVLLIVACLLPSLAIAQGPYPPVIYVGGTLQKTSTGNAITITGIGPTYTINGVALSGTGATVPGGTTFVPGTNLVLTSGTLNAGTATFGSAAYSLSTAFDVAGAAAAVTTASIGAVPTSRTVNGLALSGNISLAGSNISGVVTTISPSSVFTFTGGTETMNLASGTASGYLSSTDWTTFNNKQAAGSYVPYNGANQDLNLGGNNFSCNRGITGNTGAFGSVGISSSLSSDNGAVVTNGSGALALSLVGSGRLVLTNSANVLTGYGLGNNLTLSGTNLNAGTAALQSAAYSASTSFAPAGSYLTSIAGTNGVTITSSSIAGLTSISGSSVLGVSGSASGYPTAVSMGTLQNMLGLASAAYTTSGTYQPAFTPGTNLTLTSGTLNAGSATLGSLAYENSTSLSISGTQTVSGTTSGSSKLGISATGSVLTLTPSSNGNTLIIANSAGTAQHTFDTVSGNYAAAGRITASNGFSTGGGGNIIANGSGLSFQNNNATTLQFVDGGTFMYIANQKNNGLVLNSFGTYTETNATFGVACVPGTNVEAQVQTASAATKGMVIVASGSQTANLYEAQTSAGTAGVVWSVSGGSATGVAGAMCSAVSQSTVTATGVAATGTVICSMPMQGASYKMVLINLNGSTGTTTSYTYPVAFSVTPSVILGSGISGTITANTTSVTIATTAMNGFVEIIGY
jgi:hypothetical protein